MTSDWMIEMDLWLNVGDDRMGWVTKRKRILEHDLCFKFTSGLKLVKWLELLNWIEMMMTNAMMTMMMNNMLYLWSTYSNTLRMTELQTLHSRLQWPYVSWIDNCTNNLLIPSPWSQTTTTDPYARPNNHEFISTNVSSFKLEASCPGVLRVGKQLIKLFIIVKLVRHKLLYLPRHTNKL